ncbi:MAG: VWA domain-containing protein, partial [Acidobacteria bacterium]|nr:VWA domain-containing protein [Acidobacteriota bacterium]
MLTSDAGMYGYMYPLNTEKFSAKPLQELSLRVNLSGRERLKTIFSPTHEVTTKREGDRTATISFQGSNVKPDIDFVLYFHTDTDPVGLSMLAHRPRGEDGYFLISAAPDYASGSDQVLPKDITFVADTSGSMTEGKLDQARKALLFCLDNLNSQDRFEVIRFST